MSYCRWSSDCYQSDVYVYADVSGGFTTCVSGRRYRPLKPVPTPPAESSPGGYLLYWSECSAWIDDQSNWEWQDVEHEAAGQSFNDDTAKECADRLRALRAAGLNVPQYAIDDLDAETGAES